MRRNDGAVSPMSNAGRNTYVTEHITAALLQLLREKPLKAITISELCARAEVGRASFYRNFNDKEDILRRCIHELFHTWMQESGLGTDKPLSELLRSLFAHFEKYRDFYEVLNRQHLIYLVKDALFELCGPQPSHAKEEAYARAYFAYTLYGWIEVWFQRGMQESAEEIAGMFQAQGL